jgi:hypothetical protein
MVLDPTSFRQSLQSRREELQGQVDHINMLLQQSSGLLESIETIIMNKSNHKTTTPPTPHRVIADDMLLIPHSSPVQTTPLISHRRRHSVDSYEHHCIQRPPTPPAILFPIHNDRLRRDHTQQDPANSNTQ